MKNGALWLAGLLLLTGGCATHAERVRDARHRFQAGDLEVAERLFDEQLERARDPSLVKLDLAMVKLARGRPQEAERLLRDVRDRFDELEQVDLTEQTAKWLADDRSVAYAGEDYEKVLIRAMLALSNLLGDGRDALAYSFQINAKQDEIVAAGDDGSGENPKLAYRRVALGQYLHGVLREVGRRQYDEAERAYAKVLDWQPDFAFARQDLERAQHGRHSQPGHGVVLLIALVGRGPYKEEAAEQPTSAALLVADRILSATGKHTLPPTIAPIKVSRIVRAPQPLLGVQLASEGRPLAVTSTITDVGQLAVQQAEAVRHLQIGRAVARRVVKKGLVYASKEVLQVDQPLANFALDMAGAAWEATERADTRCWSLLPDRIQVARVELPAGPHSLELVPVEQHGRLRTPHRVELEVVDGRNTYILVQLPDSAPLGTPLVACPSGR